MTSSMLLHDIIMTSRCCQRFAVSGNDFVFQQDSAPAHHAAHACNSWTASRNASYFFASNLWPPNSHGLHPVDYVIWAVVQHCVYHRQIHSVDDLKLRLIDVWCDLEQSIFDETIDQWPGRCRACVHAKGGHFEYSLWTYNVDFVHICYIQCDLFDCFIFNYQIMPATVSNNSCSFYKVVY